MPSSVTYSSTRGGERNLDFRTVVMQGLAKDRGLFVPDTIPTITDVELQQWKNLSYAQVAVNVIAKFVQEDQVPTNVLKDIVTKSCAAFTAPDVTPLVAVHGHSILELFHGPTFAFKDVALQMLGHFFAYFLKTGSNGGRLTILGATSGDTGSAAIAGLRGKPGVQCIILFPHGRVSDIQERQMTSVLDENIHCVAVDGTFDDCQDIVKASFDTPDFRDAVHLGAVNSINWCRVLAQTTYYVWTYLRLTTTTTTNTTDNDSSSGEIHFSVPTGNFGDVLAGYYAKRMGLTRIGKLIVATNENDILHRFFTKGEYHREKIQATISPSMDICVSSNFERYLYHLASDDSNILNGWMNAFEATGRLTIDGALLRRAQGDFDAARADTQATLQTIREYYETDGYILCPHSAVGVAAIHQLGLVQPHTVCLATAHAGKFPDAVRSVVPAEASITPPALAALATRPTRRTELPNDAKAVQAFVRNVVANDEKQKRQLRQMTMAGAAGAAIVVAAVVVQVLILKSRRR